MPEDNKNAPNEPSPEGGEGDLLNSGTPPDTGSEDDGDFAALAEQFGVDVSELSEEALPQVELALRSAHGVLHDLREEDSLDLTGMKEKAAQYDRVMADPNVRAALSGQRAAPMAAPANDPAQKSFFSAETLEVALNSDSPEVFAKTLDDGVKKAIDAHFATLDTGRLAPLEKVVTTIVEMTTLDSDYPEWRKDMSRVRQVLNVHPEYSIRQAYESGVVVPRYKQDRTRLRDKLATNKAAKRKLIKGEPAPASKNATQNKEKEYDTVRDSVLAAIEASAGGE